MRSSLLRRGFTIVELLIVIVVIAILAAITIAAFRGVQDKARTSAVSSALAQATKKLATYAVDGTGYPADLASIGITDTSGISYQYSYSNTASPATYCITATSGGTSYKASSTDTTPTSGGCAGHGVGGVAAITNLVPNPSFEANSTDWSYRWWGSAGGSGNNIRPTTGGLNGNAHLRKIWTVAGASGDNGFNSSLGKIAVSAGQSYTISGSMRTNRSDVSARIGVAWYDSSNVVIGTTTWYSSTVLAANTWRQLTQNVTAPTGATSLVIIFSNSNGVSWAVNDTFDLDGTMVSESASNYADGDSPNWAWNGTPNNSTSRGPAL